MRLVFMLCLTLIYEASVYALPDMVWAVSVYTVPDLIYAVSVYTVPDAGLCG